MLSREVAWSLVGTLSRSGWWTNWVSTKTHASSTSEAWSSHKPASRSDLSVALRWQWHSSWVFSVPRIVHLSVVSRCRRSSVFVLPGMVSPWISMVVIVIVRRIIAMVLLPWSSSAWGSADNLVVPVVRPSFIRIRSFLLRLPGFPSSLILLLDLRVIAAQMNLEGVTGYLRLDGDALAALVLSLGARSLAFAFLDLGVLWLLEVLLNRLWFLLFSLLLSLLTRLRLNELPWLWFLVASLS